jgi:hypothetical protein
VKNKAQPATYHAVRAVSEFAHDVRDASPRTMSPPTMAGALIYARVLVAWADVDLDAHMSGRAGHTLGRPLAEAVLRIAAVRS